MSYKMAVDSGYLVHYGTKGMKWGVWNDETKRKYGLANASLQGGGAGKEDEEGEGESPLPSDVQDYVENYNPTTETGRENRRSLMDWLVEQGIQNVKNVLNAHLDDIQSGNIGRTEAQVVGVVNAAAAGISGSGKGVISNPKAEEMGVTYGQKSDEYKHIK